MMKVCDSSNMTCANLRETPEFSRREVLRLGGLCGVSLTLPQVLRAKQGRPASVSSPQTFGRAKQVIMLYLHGGHPQQETFDPKPHGPAAVRGEFSSIATSVTGVRFSEVLPLAAARMQRLAVVRSMSHENPNHVQASLPANTGHKHSRDKSQLGDFPPSETDFPPIGAVLDAVRQAEAALPTWVRVGPLMRRNNGTVLHGQTPGLLGQQHASFAVDQKLLGENVRIDAIQPNDTLTSIRLTARKRLLAQFDAQRRLINQSAEARNFDAFYQRAFDLLASSRTRQAFDLASESSSTRRRYGPTEFGRRCLLARRLAEAGVPMINVSYCYKPGDSWDTHGSNFKRMRNQLAPTFEPAFAALVDDLHERGLADETLLIVNAEFGRTPKINKSAGRDHWPWVYSLVLTGAGINPGVVYGASDNAAAYPTAHPHDPADMAATIYHLLGVPPETTITDALDREHRVILGQPISGILV